MISSDDVLSGNRRALAKAITLIESQRPDDSTKAQTLLDELMPYTGNSVRIGISGVPGVGKSTFIEAFGLYLLEQGKRVAVLAVDPSSPLVGGSILGDKTRMERLSRSEGAFIRPSPTAGALGGVANKTRESLLLCEAAGYDVILVETVGVGQSEYEVASMVDFFLVLMLPNAGDELQGLKKGIIELSDALLVNKADGDQKASAELAKKHYENAFHLLRQNSFWTPQVHTMSALEGDGIAAVWGMIVDYVLRAKAQGQFDEKRRQQNRDWLDHLVGELLHQRIAANADLKAQWQALQGAVTAGELSAYAAAQQWITRLMSGGL